MAKILLDEQPKEVSDCPIGKHVGDAECFGCVNICKEKHDDIVQSITETSRNEFNKLNESIKKK